LSPVPPMSIASVLTSRGQLLGRAGVVFLATAFRAVVLFAAGRFAGGVVAEAVVAGGVVVGAGGGASSLVMADTVGVFRAA